MINEGFNKYNPAISHALLGGALWSGKRTYVATSGKGVIKWDGVVPAVLIDEGTGLSKANISVGENEITILAKRDREIDFMEHAKEASERDDIELVRWDKRLATRLLGLNEKDIEEMEELAIRKAEKILGRKEIGTVLVTFDFITGNVYTVSFAVRSERYFVIEGKATAQVFMTAVHPGFMALNVERDAKAIEKVLKEFKEKKDIYEDLAKEVTKLKSPTEAIDELIRKWNDEWSDVIVHYWRVVSPASSLAYWAKAYGSMWLDDIDSELLQSLLAFNGAALLSPPRYSGIFRVKANTDKEIKLRKIGTIVIGREETKVEWLPKGEPVETTFVPYAVGDCGGVLLGYCVLLQSQLSPAIGRKKMTKEFAKKTAVGMDTLLL